MGDGGFGWGYATAPALHREAPENGLCHLVIMANFGGTCRLGNGGSSRSRVQKLPWPAGVTLWHARAQAVLLALPVRRTF